MARCTERRRKTKSNIKKQSMDKVLMTEAREHFKKYKNDVTREAYEKNYKRYVEYCRKKHNSKSKEECSKYIQEYVDFLKSQGKTASTVHTYIAPVCNYHNVPMSDICKDTRKVSENVRSRTRGNKYDHSEQRYDNPKYSLVAEFQARVGIRRSELKRLCLDDLVVDESGYYCIRVKRGKGGKFHLQRILPEDVDFIKNYFKTPNCSERLFKNSDFSNKMDYHHLRAKRSKRAYKFYYEQLHTGDKKTDLENAHKLIGELIARWNKYNIDSKTSNPRPFPFKNTKGVYKLRGGNRKKALLDGLPVEFDKLAIFAVSVFHLSHWRLDTLANYLLAV